MPRFLFLLIFCFSAFSAVAADQDTYFVSGVAVTATGKSPADAKATAHANARRDAFVILLTRLGLDESVASTVTNDEISDMVRSEQIENESIAGRNYSATFNIMFAKDFVDHILGQKKVSALKEDVTKEKYLLIAVKMKQGKPLVWGEANDWGKAVAKILDERTNDFVMPDADIANVATLDTRNAISPDYLGLEPMMTRYKTNNAYVLTFAYDESATKVMVDVLSVNKMQKRKVRINFVNSGSLKQEVLLSKVAERTIDYVMKSQKESLARNINPDAVRFKIYVNSLNDWLQIKSRIEGSNLVNQLNIESISRDLIVVNVSYIGQGEISESFALKGIQLNRQPDNSFAINAN